MTATQYLNTKSIYKGVCYEPSRTNLVLLDYEIEVVHPSPVKHDTYWVHFKTCRKLWMQL